MKRILPMIGVLLLVLSCEPSVPKIAQVFSQLNECYDPVKKSWSENLSLWILANNEDGIEDFDTMIISNPDKALFWSLQKATWSKVIRNGEVWLGSNSLIPWKKEFSTGTWKVILATRAGKKAETTFVLPPPMKILTTATARKSINFDPEQSSRVEGFPSSYFIFAYSDKGEFLFSIKKNTPDVDVLRLSPDQNIQKQIRSFYFYSYDIDAARGVFAGPYTLNNP